MRRDGYVTVRHVADNPYVAVDLAVARVRPAVSRLVRRAVRTAGATKGVGSVRMRIPECVHSFYAVDSGQPSDLRTLLFLDYDPVLPGWPPEDAAVGRRREKGRAVADGLSDACDGDLDDDAEHDAGVADERDSIVA